MVGQGRHPILAVRSIDPVLSLVSPIGLAGSLGTGLVIDLVTSGGQGARTLRDLLVDGPTLDELSPGRGGVAFLRGGGVEVGEATDLLDRLASRWPAVVLRVTGITSAYPTVPVIPLYPGSLLRSEETMGVWQPVGQGSTPPGAGPVLPRLRPGALRRLLGGTLPRRSRWVLAWRQVWEMPWA